jgi:hypothetical protein
MNMTSMLAKTRPAHIERAIGLSGAGGAGGYPSKVAVGDLADD